MAFYLRGFDFEVDFSKLNKNSVYIFDDPNVSGCYYLPNRWNGPRVFYAKNFFQSHCLTSYNGRVQFFGGVYIYFTF